MARLLARTADTLKQVRLVSPSMFVCWVFSKSAPVDLVC
jgi:hypothetical protein